MNKIVLAVLTVTLFAASAQAQDRPPSNYPSDNAKYAWADVLRVDPVYESVRTRNPREECTDVPVERRDSGNAAGATVLGAIVGGVLGNTVGKGDGRRAATVVGAVAGGAIGNSAANRGNGYYNDVETHCRVVNDVVEERRIAGYDVQYRYRGDIFASRLDYDPGERMRVRVSVEPAE